jgi:hypothetical protein
MIQNINQDRFMRSKILDYNEFVDKVTREVISEMPIEYSFGYVNIAIMRDFPSWAKLTKSSDVDYDNLYTTLFVYFNGDRIEQQGQWSTLGAFQIEYAYRFDFLHPVSHIHGTEKVFWERISEFLDKFRNFDYRVIKAEGKNYLQSTIIYPLTAVFSSPYMEFANFFCHYAAYELRIVDVQPYGAMMGRLG